MRHGLSVALLAAALALAIAGCADGGDGGDGADGGGNGGGNGGGDGGGGGQDLTPPTVVDTEPGDEATGVPLGAAISVTFDEPIDPASAGGIAIEVRDLDTDQGVPGAVTVSGPTVTFTPGPPAEPHSFSVVVRGVRDLAGNALAGEHAFRFTTGLGSWEPLPDGDGQARSWASMVWTGEELIVWGGWGRDELGGPPSSATGARLRLDGGGWTPVANEGRPGPRYLQLGFWTGEAMLVFGGYSDVGEQYLLADGGLYDPAADAWSPLPAGGPAPAPFTGVFTGEELLVFGRARDGSAVGGRYDPAAGSWRTLSTAGAPAGGGAAAVWTGTELIVWGGLADNACVRGGARYDPAADSWRPLPLEGAPDLRCAPAVAWAGDRLVVWGGHVPEGGGDRADGAAFHPATDTWTPLATEAAPTARNSAAAVWTGSHVLVWGGYGGGRSGGRYDPATDSWSPMSTLRAPANRANHAATWTGAELVVFGGDAGPYFSDGARYTP